MLISCDNPGDTELPGCPMRVAVYVISVPPAIVAVLYGQDVGSTIVCDLSGGIKLYFLAYMSLLTIEDRGTLPPPFRNVVAPHFQVDL